MRPCSTYFRFFKPRSLFQLQTLHCTWESVMDYTATKRGGPVKKLHLQTLEFEFHKVSTYYRTLFLFNELIQKKKRPVLSLSLIEQAVCTLSNLNLIKCQTLSISDTHICIYLLKFDIRGLEYLFSEILYNFKPAAAKSFLQKRLMMIIQIPHERQLLINFSPYTFTFFKNEFK